MKVWQLQDLSLQVRQSFCSPLRSVGTSHRDRHLGEGHSSLFSYVECFPTVLPGTCICLAEIASNGEAISRLGRMRCWEIITVVVPVPVTGTQSYQITLRYFAISSQHTVIQ
jgi:hypothetical protein